MDIQTASGSSRLAADGDIVVAARSAHFMFAYTGVGLVADAGGTWLLPRLVGLRKAQEIISLNRRLTAEEALAEGLITRVVDAEILAQEAFLIAEQLAAGPTRAYGRVRKLLLSAFGETLETAVEREALEMASSAEEADGKEGIAAFLEKRAPAFTGGR